MRAVERFDPEKGFRFSTYASWWIRPGVQRGVRDKGRAIRLPVHMGDRVAKAHATRASLLAQTGRDPSAREIADALGWKTEQAEDALSVPPDPTSLDRPIGPDRGEPGAALVGQLVADPSPEAAPEEDFVQALEDERALAALKDALASLPPPERTIIAGRYGIGGREPRKIQDIAEDLGLSRERVRQLQRCAEDTLRRSLSPPCDDQRTHPPVSLSVYTSTRIENYADKRGRGGARSGRWQGRGRRGGRPWRARGRGSRGCPPSDFMVADGGESCARGF